VRIGASEPRITLPPASETTGPAGVSKPAAPAAGTTEPSPFAQLLHGLGREIASGEATMHHAVAAKSDLGPAELIALQANVYRYSEAIDLASRLVDHATSGVKTIVQGGGQ
jgi:hypothetical protein